MPRSYRLGERAALVQATRDRIIEAAIELYTEVGISAATMREIGARADVAPGTLRNHFPSRLDLDRAMVERLAAAVTLPEPSIFDGTRTLGERLARLIGAGGTFCDQARRLYRMWLREPMLTSPWIEKGEEYGTRWESLMRTALGPLADDQEAMTVLRAVIHPQFYDSMRAGGRSTDEASALVTAVVVPWFTARARSER
ncbi:MAG TPA: TetR/AcrR family transcriptional regulator [Candidatus Limnocylindrales bacterium]|nr:TetR/AcrR family transcriptional regulator [Candidatus Limnocylindrales bacterium]